MAQNTPFLDYELRLTNSATKKMCKELGIKTTAELPERLKTMTDEDCEKIIALAIKANVPEMTLEKMQEEGGLFDKYTGLDSDKAPSDLINVAIQVLFDSGILVKEETPVADKGEPPLSQLTNG